ncbi:PPR repeat [Musa troglodytarum]|uniref:PPR repeat n=1 Tax=Musa troglodytarum TaxID=320322 RepID=A0A9E7FQA5_9LILI|nr:PPR repeat [Musa troglodytarum]
MFKIFLSRLCENGDVDTGLEVFKDNLKLNKVPGFRTMKLLVEGLVKGTKLKEAKAVVDKVKKRFPENLVHGWNKVEKELGLSVDDQVWDQLKVF